MAGIKPKAVPGAKANQVRDATFCRCGHLGARHMRTDGDTHCCARGCDCAAFWIEAYRTPPDGSWMPSSLAPRTHRGHGPGA